MADNTLVKMKTGTIAKLMHEDNTAPEVALDEGSVYFAVDTEKHIGKIVYDAPDGSGGVDRIVMSTYSDVVPGAENSGLMTGAQASKLQGIANGAEVNQNAFSNIKIGSTTVSADAKTDTVQLVGSNVTLTPDATNDKITIGITKSNVTTALGYTPVETDTTYGVATTDTDGLMSKTDKQKLDGIAVSSISGSAPISASTSAAGVATISHNTSGPSTTGDTSKGDTANQTPGFGGTFKVTSGTVDKFGHTKTFAEHNVTIPATEASTSTKGLMTTSQVSKLEGIANGAEVNQNAFANIKVGTTTIAADAKQDTVELVGSNVTLTPDATNDKVTIGITKANVTSALGYTPPTVNTTYDKATSGADGLMSKEDKAAFDNGVTIAGNTIAIGGSLASNTLRTSLGLSNALHFIGKATVNITDGSTTDPEISGYTVSTDRKAGDVIIDKNNSREYVWTAAGAWEELGPDGSYSLVDHTHSTVTAGDSTTAGGFMSQSDKQKLDGIASGAKNTTISATSPIVASASTGAVSLTHATSGPSATASTSKGDTANKTPGFGETFKVTSGTVDKYGHTTAFAEHTVTIPATEATASNKGLMTSTQASKLDGIAGGAQVNIIESVKMNNTALTVSSKAVNIPLMGAATASAASTIGLVPAPAKGKQTAFLRGDGTWVVPTDTKYNNATTSTAGLMSADDKTKLDGIAAGSQVNVIESVKMNNTALTVTSKAVNIPLMGAATASAAGTVGVVPAPGAGKQTSFLRGDGAWVVPTDTKYNNATTSAAGLMSADDKSKLDGIQAGADAVSFSRSLTSGTKIGTITINGTATDLYSTNWTAFKGATSSAAGTAGYINAAPTTAQTLSYFAGNGTWRGVVTETSGDLGLMSAAMLTKLNGIANGANNYTHPSHTAHAAGLYKVTIDALGHVTAATAVAKADITNLGIPGSNTDTKNTAGATNTSSKIYLIGATAQTANPTTNSDDQVYATNGQLDANKVRVAENVTLEYNSTTKSLDFIFA